MAAGGLVAHACLLLGATPSPLPPLTNVDPVAAEARDVPLGAPTERVRPGIRARQYDPAITQSNPGAVRAPPPEAFPQDSLPIPDRYRLADNLGIRVNRFDPYHQNDLKGDRPVKGTTDCFVALTGVSDTVVEPRSFPIPVGVQTTQRPGSLDVFGRDNAFVFSQTFLVGGSIFKGATAFKPPEIEVRGIFAYNVTYAQVEERRVLSVLPAREPHRLSSFFGIQELFVDYHLRNVSARYDFDSVRVGIQPFSSDFRGFLFQDNQLGVRVFGNRDNNRFQYNLAIFNRLEKDTNSGLNDVRQTPRDDQIVIANLYRQDLPVPGFTSQITIIYNRNHERALHVDGNGFPVRPALLGDLRPRSYDVVYPGYSGDGHFGRVNLTTSVYGAFGEDRNSIFTQRPTRIAAFFAAAEASYDIDYLRVRVSGLFASGDNNPYDNKETGFDAIAENPLFAGADTSYWIRQSIPFAGGGRAITVNSRNGVLNDLRSSKDEGQSNFQNPGTILVGVGVDADLTTQFRVTGNVNHLWFATTEVLEALRQQARIGHDIGWDLSVATIYRPKFTQNIVVRASLAGLVPGDGFKQLFTNEARNSIYYSALLNITLSY